MSIELITAEVCPYAQRSHLCLLEKGLDFERREVDLKNKPQWFHEVSPYAKVPVLRDGDTRVFESSIINEYLEDAYCEPRLLPESPAGRAEARIWIDFDNMKLVTTQYRVLLAKTQERRRELAQDLQDQLRYLEKEGFTDDRDGPYWFGADISLVDLNLYPHFERFCVLTHYRGLEIPNSCSKLKAWIAAMRKRPSVVATAHDDDYHINAYASYANGTANGTTAKDMRESI